MSLVGCDTIYFPMSSWLRRHRRHVSAVFRRRRCQWVCCVSSCSVVSVLLLLRLSCIRCRFLGGVAVACRHKRPALFRNPGRPRDSSGRDPMCCMGAQSFCIRARASWHNVRRSSWWPFWPPLLHANLRMSSLCIIASSSCRRPRSPSSYWRSRPKTHRTLLDCGTPPMVHLTLKPPASFSPEMVMWPQRWDLLLGLCADPW